MNSRGSRFWVNLWQYCPRRATDCAKPAPASVPLAGCRARCGAGGEAGVEAVLAQHGLSDVVMVRDELAEQLCVWEQG